MIEQILRFKQVVLKPTASTTINYEMFDLRHTIKNAFLASQSTAYFHLSPLLLIELHVYNVHITTI